ncbi:MAG: hypothetical protein ACOC5B_03685, partial [Myxococcota bacterium]
MTSEIYPEPRRGKGLVTMMLWNFGLGPGSQAVFSLYTARISERAIKEHAQALREAAAAASKHSKTLVRATWCLAVA